VGGQGKYQPFVKAGKDVDGEGKGEIERERRRRGGKGLGGARPPQQLWQSETSTLRQTMACQLRTPSGESRGEVPKRWGGTKSHEYHGGGSESGKRQPMRGLLF